MTDLKSQLDPHPNANNPPFIASLLASFISKTISTTITAPMNFIETRYQVMGEMKRNGLINQTYTSYANCITTAIKEQNGVKTLWKGNFAKILTACTGLIFSLTAGDYGKREITKMSKGTQYDSLVHSKYFGNIAGMISSLGSIIISYPLEYAYVRLVADKQSVTKDGVKQFSSIRQVLSETFKGDGIRGLYRGLFTSFGGIILYRVSYFGLYDLWKSLSNKSHSLIQTFLYSYFITLTAGSIAYPFNTIRRRMMMRSLETQTYKWSGDCLKYIVKNQGYLALYRGYPISLISAIFGSFVLMTYDHLKVHFEFNHY